MATTSVKPMQYLAIRFFILVTKYPQKYNTAHMLILMSHY